MKKNTCLLLILTLPFIGLAQGVKANLFDKFLKKQRIEMEPVAITGLTGANKLSIDFSAVASTLYLNLNGVGWGAATVDKENELVLRFSNDSSIRVKSTSLQSFEPGLMQNAYRHQYYLGFHDLELLSRYNLVALRKYSFDSFADLALAKENAENIKALSAAFLAELKAANISNTVKAIDVRDIRNYIGDSVSFCSKVYNTRYFQNSEDGPTLLDVQADFSNPFVNVVILAKDRAAFNNNPEQRYRNKDVCISGVVRLRNNLPYLVIRNPEQIRVNSEVALSEAALFTGDSVAVVGPVSSVQSSGSNPQIMQLQMGASEGGPQLTVLLHSGNEAAYRNQYIRVAGKIVSTGRGLQLEVNEPGQVSVMDAAAATALFAADQKESGLANAANSANAVVKTNATSGGTRTETLAEFPGGAEAFSDYLEKNLAAFIKPKRQSQVILSFEIDAQGNCGGVRIVDSPGPAFDAQVKLLLSKMQKWKPAFSNGRFVTTRITQPLSFKGS